MSPPASGAARSRFYLDLCDHWWRAVEIDDVGWRLVDRPPVKFRRTRDSQTLPRTQAGGSLELAPLRRSPAAGYYRSFLVAAPRSGSPYSVRQGRAGPGKVPRPASTLAPWRSGMSLREIGSLTTSTRNSSLVCFDNRAAYRRISRLATALRPVRSLTISQFLVKNRDRGKY